MSGQIGYRQLAIGNGFTFIEVLFAIIILGIGMIMIAGMLPVAIKQNSDTRNDITGKALCDSAYAYLRAVIQNNPNAFPQTSTAAPVLGSPGWSPTKCPGFEDLYRAPLGAPVNSPPLPAPQIANAGRVVPLTTDLVVNNTNVNYVFRPLQSLQSDRIGNTDPRFQWTAFYRRDANTNLVRLTILATRLQATDQAAGYSAATQANESLYNPNVGAIGVEGNGPFLVECEIEDSSLEADKIKFTGTGRLAMDEFVAAEGAYVIIAHSPPPAPTNNSPDAQRPFRNNGRVFKLGARRDDLDATASARVWELVPGFDLPSAAAGPDGVVGTADDPADGSMNTSESFETGRDLNQYPTKADGTGLVGGTKAYAWIIGRGRSVPNDSGNLSSDFTGLAQDITALTVDIIVP